MSKLEVAKAKIDHNKANGSGIEGEISRSYEIFKAIMESGEKGFCDIKLSEYREMYYERLNKPVEK